MRFVGPAAQVVGQQRVGSALAVQVAVTAVKHGQTADKTEAKVALVSVVAIKALQHQYIAPANGLEPRLCDVQAAFSSQVECRKFDPLQIETVISGRKLAEPEALRVLDRGFRPRTTR